MARTVLEHFLIKPAVVLGQRVDSFWRRLQGGGRVRMPASYCRSLLVADNGREMDFGMVREEQTGNQWKRDYGDKKKGR